MSNIALFCQQSKLRELRNLCYRFNLLNLWIYFFVPYGGITRRKAMLFAGISACIKVRQMFAVIKSCNMQHASLEH